MQKANRIPISNKTRKIIISEFQEDIQLLEKVTSKDLTRWTMS